MRRPFPAYDGDESYVFVSYAHTDSRQVYTELEALRDSGLNVWYDEGISPGSRWTDDLADRLAESDLVLAFISPNFIQSEHCRNEIDFAIEQERQILLVYLEPTELPRGMKLMLAGRQAIIKSEHSQSAYARKLRSAIDNLMVEEPGRQPLRAQPARKRPWKVLAAAAVVVLAVAVSAAFYGIEGVSGPTAQARTKPLSLLIADFENNTGQEVFDGVLEEALKIGLEGAPFVTSYPRSSALRILDEISGGKVLDQKTARLVATHQGLELVLVGDVERAEEGYRLVVEGVEPLTGERRVLASEMADSPLDALSAIAELSRELRRSLGDLTTEESHLDEVFTSSSLDAVAEFAKGQALAARWRHAEAIEHYEQSTILDEHFGRAWGGWAYSTWVLGQREKSRELWDKCLSLLNTMTERERLRTLGIYYMTISGNVEKGIETYETLLEAYPADAAGYNNLAVALFSSGRFEEARAAGANLLEIYPKSLLYQANYALYSMYAGDLAAAGDQATKTLADDPNYYTAYLPLAMFELLEVDYTGAMEAYSRMQAAGAAGESLSLIGRMDLLLARGDYEGVLAAWDEADGVMGTDVNASAIARILEIRAALALGDDELAQNQLAALPDGERSDRLLFELGEIYLSMALHDQAIALVDELSGRVSITTRTHAELLRGLVAAAKGDQLAAIDHYNAALDMRDLWLAHYHLGIAYVEVGYNVEAMDEFELCRSRWGEGAAVFLDDKPSYWRLAELPYWQGRTLQAVGINEAARERYEEYVMRRDLSGGPLVDDARRSLSALKLAE